MFKIFQTRIVFTMSLLITVLLSIICRNFMYNKEILSNAGTAGLLLLPRVDIIFPETIDDNQSELDEQTAEIRVEPVEKQIKDFQERKPEEVKPVGEEKTINLIPDEIKDPGVKTITLD